MATAGEDEEIIYANIGMCKKKGNREAIINGKAETDTGVFEETRRGIPVGTQRRFDVYKDVAENVPI